MVSEQDVASYNDQSVVQKVDQLIHQAIQKGASDIHLEPCPTHLRIRLRLDGMLYDFQEMSHQEMQQVLSRIKVLAHINIAEKRLPQDGKFSIQFQDRPIDLRVSTFPTPFGEKIVIRILDRATHMIALENIGFLPDMLNEFSQVIQRPHGFLLVTGPTGSGKTTTLYSVLSTLNVREKNILTLEDPIEYHLDGITQGQINPDAGFSFERGMRALLRQDPDILMVGEIRDKQTAQIAIEAALTGHLVLSTLHTNDAPSAFMRLMEMGIEPFLINASLTGVLAQRLVRTICTNCRNKMDLEAVGKRHAHHFNIAPDQQLYEGKGCEKCDQLGYKGRTGVFEFLKTTPSLRTLISKQPKYEDIYQQAVADGMKTLAQDGAAKVAAGTISLAELSLAIA